jgi:peptide subunit release factor 1 (eRF1)
MSTSAGYVDVGTDLATTLRRLAGLRPGVPVLSLYLDLDPRELPTQDDHRTAIRSLLDEASRRVEDHETDHDGRMSLRADLERARSFLEGWSPKRARGVAVFCASHAELFETFPLPRATRTQVVIDESPFVTPLARGADTRDWLIVVVDAQHGRILHGNPEHVTDLGDLEDHVAGQHERQSTSDHQRWVEHQVDQHLERVVRAVDEHLRAGRFECVIVGGPPEIAARLQSLLPAPVRDRLAGRFAVQVRDASADDLRDAIRPCFEQHERDHERERLDRLAEGLGRGERGVAGAKRVREMLEQQRVETLLYDDGRDSPDAAQLESMIEQAAAQSAEILAVRHFADELVPHGHVAAVLRF